MPRPLYLREGDPVRIVGPRVGMDGCEKSRPHRDYFCVFSCILFLLHPYLFLYFDCPAFCLFVFTVQHTTQTSMPPAGFEPATPANDRPQTLTLDRSSTGLSRIRYPDHPARSKSLYRTGCPRRKVVRCNTHFVRNTLFSQPFDTI